MAQCRLLAGCRFYNGKMKETDGLGALYKERYCLGDNASCARYIVFKNLGRCAVPDDLYPNMETQAYKIVGGGGT